MPVKRKSFFLQVISSKLFIIAGIAVLIFLGVSLSKEIIRRHQISESIKNLEEEISNLEESNTDLSDLIAYLKSDEFAEEEARLRLGLQKDGEKVVILPDLSENNNINNNSSSGNSDSVSVEGETTNLKKWWQYFFK